MVVKAEVISGDVIKGYELREQIGAGGFGAVYRAYQTAIGREVAVKIILPSLANHPDFIRRFETEAQLIARLEHPHIIPLYDYWRDPSGAYLVTRFLRGGSLHTALKEGPFEPQPAAMLLDQITSALAVAHRNHVIHRDLKPANILMDEDGNAYLADFGIAKDLTNLNSSHTQPEAIVGSLDYLSPEQARGEPVTPQTDIYSLGVILFEMLTGEHPFPGSSSVDRLYKHLNEPLPRIRNNLKSEILERINAVIQKATAKDPSHRYSDALALSQAFREAVGLSYVHDGDRLVELLTQREQEILQLIIAGLSNREIAEELVVTVATVKWYIRQIYSKLHVRSRVQAIVRARELNLIVTGSESIDDVSMKPAATSLYLPEPENPYKGLRAFQSADHRDFFGREALTQKLVKRLDEDNSHAHFLAVVGPSGSGKSSLVKADLIPALWRGDLPGSDRWFVVEMVPGAHPLDELEIALMRIAVEHAANIKEQLQRDTRGLVRASQLILPNDGSELVLVIDQFEEVFTLVEDEATRTAFLDLLYTTVTDPRSRVRVVITLRADFYDRPLLYPDFGELVRSRMETILPLSADELERAIARPAEQVGVGFAPGLVASIIAEVNYQPGALPLLQYALTELFEQRHGRLLTHEVYQSIGGTIGALARRADEIYEGLDETGQETARQMFLRLVTLGEGVEDTRRRVARDELMAIAADNDVMDDIIDTYATYRLLSLDHDPGTRTPTVEVAHEAILREWKRLRGWLNESREEIRLQRQLAAMAAEWHAARQDSSFLVAGSRLEQFERWMRDTRLALTQLERSYLDASLTERERREAQERERQVREAALERRSRNFLRVLVAVFAIATMIAIGLTAFAFSERHNAQNNFTRAERIRLAAQAQLALDRGENVRIPALLALRSLELGYSPEADRALLTALSRDFSRQTYVGHTGRGITQARFSPDGSRVLTSGTDATARLWDTLTGEELQRFVGHVGFINDAAFMPDGQSILTGGNDGTIREWDVASGEEIRQLYEGTVPILYIALSPDGQLLAMSDEIHGGQVWRLDNDMTLLFELSGHTHLVNRMAFSPDGRTLASPSHDGTIRLWDMETGEELQRFEGHVARVWDVTFSPSGDRIATASGDQTARIWDIETGDEIHRLIGHLGAVLHVTFSPDGRLVATTSSLSSDLSVHLWDSETGIRIAQLEGHTASPNVIAFSPDGHYLLSGSLDNVPRLWDVRAETEPRVYSQPTDTFHTNTSQIAILTSDANQIISVVSNGMVRTWDVMTYQKVKEIRTESGGFVTSAAISADHNLVLTGNERGIAKLWHLEIGELIRAYEGHSEAITSVKFSPSMDFFLTGGKDNIAILWATDSGEQVMHFEGHTAPVTDVAFSPTDRLIVTVSEDGLAILWDAENGAEIRRFVSGKEGIVLSVAFSPDGRFLLTGCDDNTATLWNTETGEVVQQLVGHTGPVLVVAFSEDGRTLVTGSRDQTARLWDAESGQLIRQFVGHVSPLRTVDLSDDVELLVTGDYDSLYLWRTSLEDIIAITCEKIPSDLTVEERASYEIHDDDEVC
jgi:WD40 repeat protein/serine/threonine protein kinase